MNCTEIRLTWLCLPCRSPQHRIDGPCMHKSDCVWEVSGVWVLNFFWKDAAEYASGCVHANLPWSTGPLGCLQTKFRYMGSFSFHISMISSATVMSSAFAVWQFWFGANQWPMVLRFQSANISHFCRSLGIWRQFTEQRPQHSTWFSIHWIGSLDGTYCSVTSVTHRVQSLSFVVDQLMTMTDSTTQIQTAKVDFVPEINAHCVMLCQQIFCLCSFSVLLSLSLLVQLSSQLAISDSDVAQ